MLDQAAEAWRGAGQAEKAADILLKLQRPEDAARLLQDAGKSVGSLAPAVQAELLQRQGKHQEAAEIFEKAGSMFRAAESYREAGDFAKAKLTSASSSRSPASLRWRSWLWMPRPRGFT